VISHSSSARPTGRSRLWRLSIAPVAAVVLALLGACTWPAPGTKSAVSVVQSKPAPAATTAASTQATTGAATSTPNAGPKAGKVLLGLLCDLPGRTGLDSVRRREQQLGRKLAIDSHYYDWTDQFPGAREAEDVAVGRIPMITWWGVGNSKVINGLEDGLIRERAAAVRAFGRPVFLRWGAEMNGDWYAWSGAASGNDPAKYVAAYRHIHDLFTAAGATNARWVWAPNADSHPGGTSVKSWNNWRNYYPGDAYVDWVGIDGYNWGTVDDNVWQSPDSIFGPIYRDYAGRKPIMLAETSSVESGGSKATWVSSLSAWVKTHPAVQALVWFDTNLSSTRLDWRIDSSSAALAAFKSLGKDSWFVRTSLA
jgi:hypothetical protein